MLTLDERQAVPRGFRGRLMTDLVQGTLHGRLPIRPPADVRVPCFEPTLFPRLRSSRDDSQGANLRFKDQKLAATISLPRR